MRACFSSLIAALLLLGCSTQPANDSEDRVAAALDQLEMQPSEQRVRVRDYQVNSWRYIDSNHLIVEARVNDLYLVELHTSCFGLQSAFAIGITSSGGTVDKFENIVVRDVSGRIERCPISEIVKLEKVPEAPADDNR